MDEITLLGNAAAVPIIIAITQTLKKRFNFKRRSDIISLMVAVPICFGWSFYNATAIELAGQWASGPIVAAKAFIDLLIISFATWLSASKAYDLFVGTKKRETQNRKVLDEHVEEKEVLKKEIEGLKNGNGKKEAVVEKSSVVDSKLRNILKGR